MEIKQLNINGKQYFLASLIQRTESLGKKNILKLTGDETKEVGLTLTRNRLFTKFLFISFSLYYNLYELFLSRGADLMKIALFEKNFKWIEERMKWKIIEN